MEVNIEAIVPKTVTTEFEAVVPVLSNVDMDNYVTKEEFNVIEEKVNTEIERTQEAETQLQINIEKEATARRGEINAIEGKAALFGTFATRKDADVVNIRYENIKHSEGIFAIPAATTENAGVMSAEDKEKLDSIEIINDLTTGGADKALSAEMGKVLGNRIFGTLWNGSAKNDDTLFTSSDVSTGDVIQIELDKTYASGGIRFANKEGATVKDISFTIYPYAEYTIPENFSYAKVIWGAAFDSLKIENKSALGRIVSILDRYKQEDSLGEFTETISAYRGVTALHNIINEGDLIRISGESTTTDNLTVALSSQSGNPNANNDVQVIEANKWVKASNKALYLQDISGGGAEYITVEIIRKKPYEYTDELLQALNIIEGQWNKVTIGIVGGFVQSNGSIATTTEYNISEEIELKKNDLILLKLASQSSVACISKVVGTTYLPVLIGVAHGLMDYSWKADNDCKVVLSYRSAILAQYKVINLNILSDFEKVQEKSEKLPEPKVVLSKNLFNPADIIEGYYLSSGAGSLSPDATSAVSGLIPVTAGGEYYIYREKWIGTTVLACITEGGIRIKPLWWNNGEYVENKDFESLYQSGRIKIPENAVYVQFTCKFVGNECGYDTLQFEEGTEHTSYEPYEKRYEIGFESLPKSLTGLPEKVDNLEKHDSAITITVANSDKIGFFSNSFLNGYCMLGKHAINNLSMFSDYIMYNYGHSGDDILELLDRVNSNEKWLGDVPVQDWGIKYGVIAMQDNDGALFAASSDTYYENAKKLANAIKALGGTPILSTEHDSNNYYYNFTRLANDYKLMFMNWGSTAANLFWRVFNPFWYNSHPATRTAWMWTYGMKPYIDSLPRPEKSIKLFRVRPSVDTTDVQNLIYEDLVSRASIYEEITCGVSGLTEETEKYFDRIDTGNTKYVNYKDEYQILQSKSGSVNFGTHALIEGILPYDKKDCKSVLCKLVGTGITSLYIKKVNGISNPLPSKRYVAFGITEGSLSKGQQFQITGGVFNDNILGTYTVEDVVNNVVVTTTSSSGKTTSGTDNPTTNISGVILKGSYDYPSADYMKRYNKPLGEWAEIAISEEIDLTTFVGTCMNFDKVSLLAVGENISISDIEFVVTGSIKKENSCSKLVTPLKGTSLLTNTTFNDSDTEWNNLSTLDKYIQVVDNSNGYSEPLPKDISTVRIMNKNQSVTQAIQSSNIQHNGYETPKLQLKVIARYFPEYINSDDKWATSKIHRGSYDCANLVVKIAQSADDKNPVKIGVIPVGIWWNEFVIDTYYFKGSHLVIESESDDMQIAKCELVQV